MSDNTTKQSVRQLPAGQLDNLKKLFEDDANGSPPSRVERQPPPPRPPMPSARMKPAEGPKLPTAKKPSLGAGPGAPGSSSPALPKPNSSKDADLASAAAAVATTRKPSTGLTPQTDHSGPGPPRQQRVLSPTVSRRITALTASPSPGHANSAAVKPPVLAKPQLPRKAVVPSDPGVSVVADNPIYGESRKLEREEVAAMYSKVHKEPKNAGEPPKPGSCGSEEGSGNIHRREAVRKTSGERRKTVLSFESEGDRQDDSNGVSVAMRTKLFDGQNGGKLSPPKKSEAMRSMSMRTSREHEKQKERVSNEGATTTEDTGIYQPPWDMAKSSALEKLREAHQEKPKSAADPPRNMHKPTGVCPPTPTKPPKQNAKPPPLPSQPPPKTRAAVRKRTPSATTDSINPTARSRSPVKVPPPPAPTGKDTPAKGVPAAPPPKPPRTHLHDNYLMTKISRESEQQEQAGLQKTVEDPSNETQDTDASQEVEYFSVKDRIAKMSLQQQQQISADVQPFPSCNPPPPSTNQVEVTLRQKPPSRPPPPKRRPNSGESPSSSSPGVPPWRPLTQCPAPHKPPTHSGPIIIPVFPQSHQQRQKFFQRQTSSIHDARSRKPTDDLPQEPEDDSDYGFKPIQRFPLRKSFSSECLHSSRGSSLNLSTSGNWGDSSGVGDSMSSSAYDYQAVIDPDGYAVPNEFLKLPTQRQHSHLGVQMVEASPAQFLTKLRGFESTGAAAGRDESKAGGKHDLTKVNKKKMIMVREKINQAYAALDGALRGQEDGEDNEVVTSDTSAGARPESAEVVVEPSELKRRINHCASVRLQSCKSIKRNKEYMSAIYPQLFEYCLVVGLKPLVDVAGYEPYLIHKFPENVSSNLSVPSFCFPDASIFKPGSAASPSESYSFVMTYSDGSRVYGYCRRIQPPDCSLPEVICIISPIDAFNMYNTLLSEIEARRRVSTDLALEVIAASFGRPLPKPGKVCHIRTLDTQGEMETIFLNRPTDNRLDDVNYESPLFYLGTDRLVKVFSSLLMERRVILCSSNLSILTQTVHALSALLYPFHWQHVYIPLLPPEMLDVVCAPMPYILGVLTAFLPQVLQMDMEEVFIVDLDKKNIVRCQGDESTILPRKVQRALKTAINMCKIDSDAQNVQWLMVAEAFLRMFIETTGHFTNHVRTQQDGNRIFQKEGFILEMVSKELRQFLEWFTETQMFEVFIVDLVEKSEVWTSDVFMQRLKEHRESKEERNRSKGLGAKVKNFGKALKTKLQAS